MTYKSVIVCSVILGILIGIQLKTINLENNGMVTSRYKGDDKNQDIMSEVELYKAIAGYTDVNGPGIEIKINPLNQSQNSKEDINQSIIYNYDLLLSIINKLNSAQANAISVNGQRVVSNTYLHLKEDKLYMNDVKIDEPIIIKAIGDKDTLASALQIKYGIVWEIEEYYNYNIEIDKKDNIIINEYDKTIEYSMKDELNNLKKISGNIDVIGPGVTITIKDSEKELEENQNPNDLIVHDIDILRVINDLKKSGAEAISINGERVISSSKIKCSGATITVNDTTYGQPFVIKAIGNKESLITDIITPESYANLLKYGYGIYVEVQEEDMVFIKSIK